MRRFIPTTLTFLTTTSIFASEVFTLADGRILTGTYNAEREELQLEGPIVATLHVAPESIVERKILAENASAENPIADSDSDEQASDVADPNDDNPERRAAQVQAAIRTIDAALAKRQISRQAVLRRQQDTREALTKAQQVVTEAEAHATAAQAEHTRNQSQIDDIKQARALTEIRLQHVTTETGTSGDRQRIDVVQAELSAADERLRELHKQTAILSKAATAAASAHNKAKVNAERLTADLAKDDARLAAYAKADAQDQERRVTFVANAPEVTEK